MGHSVEFLYIINNPIDYIDQLAQVGLTDNIVFITRIDWTKLRQRLIQALGIKQNYLNFKLLKVASFYANNTQRFFKPNHKKIIYWIISGPLY